MTYQAIWLLIILLAAVSADAAANANCGLADGGDSLRQLVYVFRHGDRSPWKGFPTNPYPEWDGKWPFGFGQLMPQGVRRHYEFGQWVRTCYNNFLPATYNYTQIYTRSTNMDRTLNSAQSHLEGVYPLKNQWSDNKADDIGKVWFPRPVHTVDAKQDYLLHMWRICPKFGADAKIRFHNDTTIKQWTVKYHDLLIQLGKWTGTGVTSIFQYAIGIADTVLCFKQFNLPLPTWCNKMFFGNTVFDILQQWRGLEFKLYFANDPHSAALTTGPLLNDIVERFENTARGVGELGERGEKMHNYKHIMYSAHDTTLTGLLGLLSAYHVLPPFASSVIFELHEKGGQHYVRAYNRLNANEQTEIPLPGCHLGKPCSLVAFADAARYQGLLIPLKDAKKRCEIRPPPFQFGDAREEVQALGGAPATNSSPIMIVLGLMVIALRFH